MSFASQDFHDLPYILADARMISRFAVDYCHNTEFKPTKEDFAAVILIRMECIDTIHILDKLIELWGKRGFKT